MTLRTVSVGISAVLVIGGCGSTKTVTDTVTGPTKTVTAPARAAARVRTVTVPARTVTVQASTSTTSSATGLTLSGSGTENLGPITVPVSAVLVWSCPTCTAQDTFAVDSGVNSSGNAISLDANGQTSGQTFVDAGDYQNVQVITEGSWTITITPSG